jgi:hypothetical protein
MNRLVKLIAEMSTEDLKLIKRDLEEGTLHRLVQVRLNELEQRKQCPVCGRELSKGDQKFALEFGPADLRQRAHFDEYDCMIYFIENTLNQTHP